MKKYILVLNIILLFTISCNDDVFNSNKNYQELEARTSGGTDAQIAAFYSYQVQLGKQYHQWIISLILPSDWNALSYYDRNLILNYSDQQFAILAMYYEGVSYQSFPPDFFGSNSSPSISRISKGTKINTQRTPGDNKFWDCLEVAFGIAEISTILDLNALSTASTVAGKQALSKAAWTIGKAVGKRVAGWFAVGFMVRDFYNCYN